MSQNKLIKKHIASTSKIHLPGAATNPDSKQGSNLHSRTRNHDASGSISLNNRHTRQENSQPEKNRRAFNENVSREFNALLENSLTLKSLLDALDRLPVCHGASNKIVLAPIQLKQLDARIQMLSADLEARMTGPEWDDMAQKMGRFASRLANATPDLYLDALSSLIQLHEGSLSAETRVSLGQNLSALIARPVVQKMVCRLLTLTLSATHPAAKDVALLMQAMKGGGDEVAAELMLLQVNDQYRNLNDWHQNLLWKACEFFRERGHTLQSEIFLKKTSRQIARFDSMNEFQISKLMFALGGMPATPATESILEGLIPLIQQGRGWNAAALAFALNGLRNMSGTQATARMLATLIQKIAASGDWALHQLWHAFKSVKTMGNTLQTRALLGALLPKFRAAIQDTNLDIESTTWILLDLKPFFATSELAALLNESMLRLDRMESLPVPQHASLINLLNCIEDSSMAERFLRLLLSKFDATTQWPLDEIRYALSGVSEWEDGPLVQALMSRLTAKIPAGELDWRGVMALFQYFGKRGQASGADELIKQVLTRRVVVAENVEFVKIVVADALFGMEKLLSESPVACHGLQVLAAQVSVEFGPHIFKGPIWRMGQIMNLVAPEFPERAWLDLHGCSHRLAKEVTRVALEMMYSMAYLPPKLHVVYGGSSHRSANVGVMKDIVTTLLDSAEWLRKLPGQRDYQFTEADLIFERDGKGVPGYVRDHMNHIMSTLR
ncbi:hypothetical protein [Paraburkholderia hayleyella]|uniref:hypothetical protein n=1 Tax=Paraburkholderia hayleyella TaxID=2152889 RepID=UPI001291C6E6|nr:hypothetical protein [Paraburkholderia hayleyella]